MSTDQLDLFGQPLLPEEIEQLPGQPSDTIGELPPLAVFLGEARRIYPAEWNPRWLLYVSARGGSVESGGRGDNARFMGWVSRKIVEYGRATGRTPMHDQAAFTEWMRDNTTPGELAPAMREGDR